ncbi:MAG: TetR/AcrR family transcriptional regulator [Candidatus Pristimantibacillus sp.]
MKNREMAEKASAYPYILIAFHELLSEFLFEKITIQMISDRAGVNRSTFYLHFHDKYELYDVLTEEMLLKLLSNYMGGSLDDHNPEEAAFQSTLSICQHIKSNVAFYKQRFRNLNFIQTLSAQLYKALFAVFQDETFATFTSYGTIGYWAEWIQADCNKEAEEVAASLKNMALNYNWLSGQRSGTIV